MRLPYLDVGLVFRRVVAGQRGGVVGEIRSPHCATGRRAFAAFELTGADHEPGAEFPEDRRIGQRIGFVALVVVHIDPARSNSPSPSRNSFTAFSFRSYFLACAISATISSAAAFGSPASTIGRPTTKDNRRPRRVVSPASRYASGRRSSAAGRADARRHQRQFGADDGAQIGGLFRRTDQTIDADVARLLGAPRLVQFADAQFASPAASRSARVAGGQYRHGESLPVWSRALPSTRRLHAFEDRHAR